MFKGQTAIMPKTVHKSWSKGLRVCHPTHLIGCFCFILSKVLQNNGMKIIHVLINNCRANELI